MPNLSYPIPPNKFRRPEWDVSAFYCTPTLNFGDIKRSVSGYGYFLSIAELNPSISQVFPSRDRRYVNRPELHAYAKHPCSRSVELAFALCYPSMAVSCLHDTLRFSAIR